MWSRLRRRTVGDFAAWASERDLIPAGAEAARQWRQRIEILLDGRADFLGKPDPALWRSGDVHELLMTHVVTRQYDAWNLAEHAPSAVGQFLGFLDQTQRLHPASTRVSTLLKELGRLAPRFPEAMADSSRWRLAKRVFTAMAADGVRRDDQVDVDRWAERFSALGPAQRRAVLGDLVDQEPGYASGRLMIHDGQVAVLQPGRTASKHAVWPDAPCDCPDHREYPPVVLPGMPDLAAAVAGYGSGLLRRLVELGRWASADGRPVDGRGEPPKEQVRAAAAALGLPADEEQVRRMRDLPGLARLWRLCVEFGVLSLRRTRVIQGPGLDLAERVVRGDAEPDEALGLWAGLYEELLDCYEAPGRVARDVALLRSWLEGWTPRFLGMLFTEGSDGGWSRLDEMIGRLLEENSGMLPDDSEELTELASVAIRQPVADLAEHGAVEISPSPAELRERLPAAVRDASAALGVQSWAFSPPAGLRVRLTDLGRYAVRRQVLPEPAEVPVPAGVPS